MLLAVRPRLLAELLCKALAADGRLSVVAADDVAALPWTSGWSVAVVSTDALSITEVTGDAYVVCIPGEVPVRVASPDLGELVELVRRIAL